MVRAFLSLLLILGAAGPVGATGGATEPAKVPLSTARANAKGNELIENGKFGEAADVYREEALIRPENGILQRNLAGALARSGSMDEGLAAYGQALRFAETPTQKAKALFDLGNALAMSGQAEQALETYASAMLLDPSDMDIKHNFEYLMRQSDEQGDEQGDQQGDQEQEGDEQQEGENQADEQQEGGSEEQEGQEEQQPQPGEEEQQSEQQPEPSRDSGEENPDESMNPEDAKRLLDALLEEEKELQAERSRRKQTRDPSVEKDW